jgi:DNA-binding transcriptional ArsR family regulator
MKTRADGLLDGNGLLLCLGALANPQRLRIIAALARGRVYVSQLARDVGLSRPLLQLHLRKLEAAGLVSSRMEVSRDGKAMNFFELTRFRLVLDPERVAVAAVTLDGGPATDPRKGAPKSRPISSA